MDKQGRNYSILTKVTVYIQCRLTRKVLHYCFQVKIEEKGKGCTYIFYLVELQFSCGLQRIVYMDYIILKLV